MAAWGVCVWVHSGSFVCFAGVLVGEDRLGGGESGRAGLVVVVEGAKRNSPSLISRCAGVVDGSEAKLSAS